MGAYRVLDAIAHRFIEVNKAKTTKNYIYYLDYSPKPETAVTLQKDKATQTIPQAVAYE